MRERLGLMGVLALSRSLLDYLVTQGFFICDPSLIENRMGFLKQLTNLGYGFILDHPGETRLYFIFLQGFGFLASGFYGIARRDFKKGIDSIHRSWDIPSREYVLSLDKFIW